MRAHFSWMFYISGAARVFCFWHLVHVIDMSMPDTWLSPSGRTDVRVTEGTPVSLTNAY